MNALERRATLALAGVYATRMFGMFLVLPVFVLYAQDLPGATPALMGLALGIYGLTQAALQLPFGWLSDRFGRKPVIIVGLLVFAAGSVVAAVADDVWVLLAGRALQGAGAIAAVLSALLADLTRDDVRTRAMAVVGVTIGASFVLSLVFGPLLEVAIGVPGIFWLTAGLAVVGIAVVWWVVPEPDNPVPDRGSGAFAPRISGLTATLLRLDFGIFALHFILTACFVALPPALAALPELAGASHSTVYLPVLLGSGLLMLPLVLGADRPGVRLVLVRGMVVLLGLSLLGLVWAHTALWPLLGALLAFFTAFNVLEAHLPAEVSRAAPAHSRGSALGVYATCQFLGTFAGGAAGGVVWGLGGGAAVFGLCAVLAVAWFGVAVRRM
jgi:MFS family permease